MEVIATVGFGGIALILWIVVIHRLYTEPEVMDKPVAIVALFAMIMFLTYACELVSGGV